MDAAFRWVPIHFDWVQIGGAVKHPEEGKIIDMSKAAKQEMGIEDPYLKIYPIF